MIRTQDKNDLNPKEEHRDRHVMLIRIRCTVRVYCRSMFRNVVAALNEALDITMHLKPLTSHFEVQYGNEME